MVSPFDENKDNSVNIDAKLVSSETKLIEKEKLVSEKKKDIIEEKDEDVYSPVSSPRKNESKEEK